MKDSDVVKAFVAHLGANKFPGLIVNIRPDKENRISKEIDAIAGPFAIEHTSIDTLPNQRRDSDWFIQVVGGLEDELANKLSFSLYITLEYDAVAKGQDWKTIRKSLKTWLVNEAPNLPEGKSTIEKSSDIPFRLDVVKRTGRATGIFFSRYEPSDKSLPGRVKTAVDRKTEKLAGYQDSGRITVLLLESYDIALMNESKMFDAIRTAFPAGLPVGIDQVWYVNTSNIDDLEFYDFTEGTRNNGSVPGKVFRLSGSDRDKPLIK